MKRLSQLTARFWVRFHLWAAIAWMFPGVLLAYVIVYHMPDPHASFAILVVSLYANTVSHWGAWQAARAELKAGEIEQQKGAQ